jgi:hypothetical protein
LGFKVSGSGFWVLGLGCRGWVTPDADQFVRWGRGATPALGMRDFGLGGLVVYDLWFGKVGVRV